MKSCAIWVRTRLTTFCSETPFVTEDTVCVCVCISRSGNRLASRLNWPKQQLTKMSSGRDGPSLCQLAHHNGLLCESAGNEAEGASKVFFRWFLFEDRLTIAIHVICECLSPDVSEGVAVGVREEAAGAASKPRVPDKEPSGTPRSLEGKSTDVSFLSLCHFVSLALCLSFSRFKRIYI